MQWLQDPSQNNVDHLNNVRLEARRHFRKNKKEYLKTKIEGLETNSKIKNVRDLYRGINDFNKGYQPRNNIVKDEKGDLVADSHRILARWGEHFSQLLNVYGVTDVRQTEIHTTEPLVPDPSAFEVEMAIEMLKSHKSLDIDQIPIEFIQAGGRTICYEIHKLIISIWNKEELPEEWKESFSVPIYKMGVRTGCVNYRGISLLLTTYKILPNILLSSLTPYAEEIIGDRQCGFRRIRSTIDSYFAFVEYLRKNWNKMRQHFSYF